VATSRGYPEIIRPPAAILSSSLGGPEELGRNRSSEDFNALN
jgi:hypothetical protein